MRKKDNIASIVAIVKRLLLLLVLASGTAYGSSLDNVECVRLDTFEVHPVSNAEEVKSFVALLEAEEMLSFNVSKDALKRALEVASNLDLRAERVLLAFELLKTYSQQDPDLTSQVSLATLINNELHLLPQEHHSLVLNMMGNISSSSGDHSSALSFYQRAYEIADPSRPLDKLYPLGNLAATYLFNQDTVTALQIIHRSIKLVASADISEEEVAYSNVYDYSELGNIYLSRQQIDSAKIYLTFAAKNSLFFEKDHFRYEEIQETLMSPYIRFQIAANNPLKALESIDSLRTILPQLSNLLEAEFFAANGNLEKALALTDYTYESNLSRDKERLELRRDIATKLRRHDLANEANRELLTISEENLARNKKELAAISKAQMEAFEKERRADITRFKNELEVLETRQRNWISGILIILSFGIAVWFNQRYRKSHKRSVNLSKMVTKHEQDLIVANEKLASKVSSMERFNHLLSHDLREPLRSISGFTSILKRKAKPYVELTEDFNLLSSSVAQLSYLMTGVEQLRRVEEKVIERSTVDLKDSIKRISKEVTAKYSDHTISIDTKCNVPALKMDKELLYKSLLEVVDNAAKFCKNKEAHITIEATQQHNELLIYVQDDGIGMNTDFSEQIFGIFKRLNRREHYVGSGVGLALAKLAAEKCLGSIDLLESHQGKGSTFQLTFPLAKATSNTSSGHRQVASPVW